MTYYLAGYRIRRPVRHIYFAHIGDYVKVGFSTNPEKRVKTLRSPGERTIHPALRADGAGPFIPALEPLRSLHSVPTRRYPHDAESEAHCALYQYHVNGEWFIGEPDLIAWIERQETDRFSWLPRAGGPYHEPVTRRMTPHPST